MPKISKFQVEVKNEIVITSQNTFYKLPTEIFGITQLKLFELKHQKWSGNGSLNKENFQTYLVNLKVDW